MSSLDNALEREFPAYFIFGVRADGRVDIASTRDDTVATMSRDKLVEASELLADRTPPRGASIPQKLAASARALRLIWSNSNEQN